LTYRKIVWHYFAGIDRHLLNGNWRWITFVIQIVTGMLNMDTFDQPIEERNTKIPYFYE